VGQLDLGATDGHIPHAVLNPEDEKNGMGSDIPLREDQGASAEPRVTGDDDKRKTRLASVDNRKTRQRATGLGPATFSLEGKSLPSQPTPNTRLAAASESPCTTPCTNSVQPAGGPLAALAADLLNLSPGDRTRLALLLAAGQNNS
jgi:hypothetical protein